MGGGARGRARARGGNQRREVVAARSFDEVQLPEASNFTGDVMPLLGNVSREKFPPNAGRALQRGAACPLRAGVCGGAAPLPEAPSPGSTPRGQFSSSAARRVRAAGSSSPAAGEGTLGLGCESSDRAALR